MSPLYEIVGWLYDILDKLEWRMPPLEILRTEREFPGLIEDIAIESWQRRLVRDQIAGAKKEPVYYE